MLGTGFVQDPKADRRHSIYWIQKDLTENAPKEAINKEHTQKNSLKNQRRAEILAGRARLRTVQNRNWTTNGRLVATTGPNEKEQTIKLIHLGKEIESSLTAFTTTFDPLMIRHRWPSSTDFQSPRRPSQSPPLAPLFMTLGSKKHIQCRAVFLKRFQTNWTLK